jgi:phospholipid/cholesterol/gamma-HCH transport system ATP-binding protein
MSIEIRNLRKSFGTKEVLKGIDFDFERGKINMIIGASGSGKSVMLKCIVGLIKPDVGSVSYDGVDFHQVDSRELKDLRRNIGMLFQSSALFDSMTVEENISFPLKMFTKVSQKDAVKRVDACLDKVSMPNVNHLYPAELSGGMQKRVGLARAIAMNPKYLFVDEPNSGLDPLTASVIDKLIRELTSEFDMTTVMVSHDMNSVMNVGDKIMFLYKGHKEWEGSNRDILGDTTPALEEFVFVSDLINKREG